MISNAEIERYAEFARIRSKRGVGSSHEVNLAMMVINLVKVIDHLTAELAKKDASPSQECVWVCGVCGQSPEVHGDARSTCVYKPVLKLASTTVIALKVERGKFYDALDNVLNAIQDSRGALDNYSDIDSEGRANWAMALLQLADKYEEIL